MRQLTNIFRRVYRIFAHAWYSHREVFWKVEGRTGLYIFYKTVCDVYGLVPEDNYTIPPEAEGIEPSTEAKPSAPPMIIKREPSDSTSQISDSTTAEGMSDHSLSTAGTTKRHRHSPSVGPMAVQTVVEENEEEEERPSLQPRPVTQIFESTQADEEDEDGDSDGDVTAIEDNEEDDDDDDDDEDDEDEDEAEAEASEEMREAAKDATDETTKESASGEKAAGTSSEDEEKQNEEATAESATAGPAGATVSDAQDGEKESSKDGAETEKDDSKAVGEGSEQAKKPDSASKPGGEEDGPKVQD
jgi:hypothetical protein